MSGVRRRAQKAARELTDDGFAAVFGAGRGAALSATPVVGEVSAGALARRERLAEAGGIESVLQRASMSSGDFDAVEFLREDLVDVADELCDGALAAGAGLRGQLARLLDTPVLEEFPSRERLTWNVHRSVMRNCVRHDEAWLRERALLAHDKDLGRRIESSVMMEGRADWLRLTDDEERRLIGAASGAPLVRADWKAFVSELRATGDVDRMRPSDLRLLFVGHLHRRFRAAVKRRR